MCRRSFPDDPFAPERDVRLFIARVAGAILPEFTKPVAPAEFGDGMAEFLDVRNEGPARLEPGDGVRDRDAHLRVQNEDVDMGDEQEVEMLRQLRRATMVDVDAETGRGRLDLRFSIRKPRQQPLPPPVRLHDARLPPEPLRSSRLSILAIASSGSTAMRARLGEKLLVGTLSAPSGAAPSSFCADARSRHVRNRCGLLPNPTRGGESRFEVKDVC